MPSPLEKFFRPEIRKRHAYQLATYPKLIKLNQNELAYDFTPAMKQELAARLKKLSFNRYPATQPEELQKKLAQVLRVRPEQLLVSNGSNVMIQVLINATAIKGRVMALEPSFSLFESEARLFGDRFIPIKLKAPDFHLPLDTFLKKLKTERPQIVFIANPNAPTGTLFPQEHLEEIVRRAKCPVVIDEAYYQFTKITCLSWLKKYPHVLILRTFSKGFGLGGARVGYLVGVPEMIHQVRKALLPYCVPVFSEAAALVALDHRTHYRKLVDRCVSERNRLYQAMKKISGIEVYPSHTNFILFRVKDAKRCMKQLMKHGVLIRDMSAKPHMRGCLRVSIGLPGENDAFLQAMKKSV